MVILVRGQVWKPLLQREGPLLYASLPMVETNRSGHHWHIAEMNNVWVVKMFHSQDNHIKITLTCYFSNIETSMFLSRWRNSKNCWFLLKLNPGETSEAGREHASKEQTIKLSGALGESEGSCELDDVYGRPNRRGCTVVWKTVDRVGRGRRVLSMCSSALDSSPNVHPTHSGGTIIDYNFPLGTHSHQCP